MSATLTWFAGTLRAGERHEAPGDPYDFVVTVVRIGDVAYLSGGNGMGSYGKECLRLLREQGMTVARWDRRVDGVNRQVEVRL